MERKSTRTQLSSESPIVIFQGGLSRATLLIAPRTRPSSWFFLNSNVHFDESSLPLRYAAVLHLFLPSDQTPAILSLLEVITRELVSRVGWVAALNVRPSFSRYSWSSNTVTDDSERQTSSSRGKHLLMGVGGTGVSEKKRSGEEK